MYRPFWQHVLPQLQPIFHLWPCDAIIRRATFTKLMKAYSMNSEYVIFDQVYNEVPLDSSYFFIYHTEQ